MRFDSFTFLFFLAIVMSCWYLFTNQVLKKGFLLVASCVFYSFWDLRFLPLIFGLGSIDYFLSKLIVKTKFKCFFLWSSVFINIAGLFWFKYSKWVAETFFDINHQYFQQSIYQGDTPLALSFTVFISLSYVIDVYRDPRACAKSYLDYMILIMYFPHLNSGPIVRATEFLPQIEKKIQFNYRNILEGLFITCTGLFSKVALTDTMVAPIVDAYYNSLFNAGYVDALIGLTAFSWQILFDFLAYSICALGVSKTLGIALPHNFNYPYMSSTIQEFWHNWHMSLSRWLRDYLYIPLGGSRQGTTRTYFNLFITMTLGGLWHGANIKFIIWGAFHGLLLSVERALFSIKNEEKWPVRICKIIFTFSTVTILWSFFRAPDFSSACRAIVNLFNFEHRSLLFSRYEVTVFVLLSLLIILISKYLKKNGFENLISKTSDFKLGIGCGLIMCLVLLCPRSGFSFIYFQF